MIIVSQDKETIINFEGITRISIMPPVEEGYKYSIAINTCLDLGYYKTKERAKEVLQAIIKEYKKVLTTFNRGTGQQRFYDLPKVYYMPEE